MHKRITKWFLIELILFCIAFKLCVAQYSEEDSYSRAECCTHGESFARSSNDKDCTGAGPPEDIDPEELETCKAAIRSCCENHYKQKDECSGGMKLAKTKQCNKPSTEVGKTCCEECSIGRLMGESQGKEFCEGPPSDYVTPLTALRKNASRQCCLEAAEEAERTTTTSTTTTTTTTKRIETTTVTEKPKPDLCKKNNPCEQTCNDVSGDVKCECKIGYRIQADGKSCKDINECAEALDDVCTEEGTVCHNTPGSFKCVPYRKRDVSLSCPPGFKRNIENQVCDDINECQLPTPPCPKYLCENTIGGFKCSGRPGKPAIEATGIPAPVEVPDVSDFPPPSTPSTRDNMCPPGFRSGDDDECLDIDECTERLDDCQRLSQHCINSHGNFFCQDHVSKRCAPGFIVNRNTGICEDIDECKESSETCQRGEVCVNLPGAYNCKSKISTLPKLATKTCQEGTRLRPGGTHCEDIDECREGLHLCDQFQNCINTYGGHECRCKSGYELDHSTGSCVDIDECAMKLDSCEAGQYCLNVLGSFTCTRRPQTSSSVRTSTTTRKYSDDMYYDSDEEELPTTPATEVSKPTTTPKPVRPKPPTTTPRPRVVPTRPPYSRPTVTTPRTTPKPTIRTTPKPTIRTSPKPIPVTIKPTLSPKPSTTSSTTTESNIPITPKQIEPPREVTVSSPDDLVTVEKETEPDGSFGLNTSDVPKNTWTNVVGTDKDEDDSNFDPNKVHCLGGYERDENGDCIDIDECNQGRHICGPTEECVNSPGRYSCDCVVGYQRNSSGRCTQVTTSTSTTSTTPKTTTPYERRPSVDWTYRPPRPSPRPYAPPIICELGFKFDTKHGRCVDVDECTNGRANCKADERCVNTEGGYKCVCGRNCRDNDEHNRNQHLPPSSSVQFNSGDPNIITVGSQYGQRGPRVMSPSYTHYPHLTASCPWGYKITPDKRCVDIDECERNVSECGPEQRCDNFFGGYSCKCPTGHRMVNKKDCADVDECSIGRPCSSHADCVNTPGSYTCTCRGGFRNAAGDARACVDVDECAERAGCQHACTNTWGGYRCSCERGYRINADNRTCDDVDECAEWEAIGRSGRLCAGSCVNVPGSYRCSCPAGYKSSSDSRSCIDINECETGKASCADGSDPNVVCQNTRGGYHCHKIECPTGYKLESKHRCTRIQRSCLMTDWECLRQPGTYSYNFITFVSKIFIPSGGADLFTMHGPSWSNSVVNFDMKLLQVQARTDLQPAERSCFDVRPNGNVCMITLLCSLEGPQVVELELSMSLYQRGQFAGSAVARLIVIVSEYEF